MTENPKTKKLVKREKPTAGIKTLPSVNANIVTLFNSTLHMLEQTIMSAKMNPAQGILGMMMVADLLHGGAYTVRMGNRPALVGSKSTYYDKENLPPAEQFPISGWNWLDPIGSIFQIFQGADESIIGAQMASEVYLNGNVPHKFPKLISDEVYAKILVSGFYLIHQSVCTIGMQNFKTYVEASAIPFKTAGEVLKDIGAAAGGTTTSAEGAVSSRGLSALLSLLEG
jgi:hypothetical protein